MVFCPLKCKLDASIKFTMLAMLPVIVLLPSKFNCVRFGGNVEIFPDIVLFPSI